MNPQSDLITRLATLRVRRRVAGDEAPASVPSRLAEMTGFGTNPGALKAHAFVPPHLPEGAALVVVLHGCTQSAAGYDAGSGWSRLAEREGFAVLFPEQTRANNPNGCFNWFSPEDARREGGEARSIRQMVGHMLARHAALDPRRVFVTGLSAGGAMAMVMLATFPDVFAGGAVIAGLPFGTAASIPEAFERMRGQGGPAGAAGLERLVREATPHAGPWPTLSVWHGDADRTVAPSNAEAILSQWRGLHGLGAAPSRVERGPAYLRRVWSDAEGRDRIEDVRIAGMGHGTPLDAAGPDAIEIGGAYMLDVGVSSTRHIAHFWGIAPEPEAARIVPGRHDAADAPRNPTPFVTTAPKAHGSGAEGPWSKPAWAADHAAAPDAAAVGQVIEDALRRAGLMR